MTLPDTTMSILGMTIELCAIFPEMGHLGHFAKSWNLVLIF
jgi:hypothetical protein